MCKYFGFGIYDSCVMNNNFGSCDYNFILLDWVNLVEVWWCVDDIWFVIKVGVDFVEVWCIGVIVCCLMIVE